MKISYHWLLELVELDAVGAQCEEIVGVLARLGLPVEGVTQVEDDTILEVDVTTNRPDCLNHLGIARELATYYGLRLNWPDTSPPAALKGLSEHPASVEIVAPDLCPRYSARVIHGVQIGPSPPWMRKRLEAVGQRSINNVVDVTNYVLLELGHPLHAFDYHQLRENRIVVRRPLENETITTLDGVERQLDPEMLLICDGVGPTALAGVMGGGPSEVSDRTTTLLLESAYFRPTSIRRTAKALDMRTEASYRFERGADFEMPVKALNRACQLILQVAGGECVGPVLDEYPEVQNPPCVRLRDSRIRQVTGLQIDPGFVSSVLGSLEFQVSGEPGSWEVEVPSFRVDVAIEDDLVEEVLRHYGYDKVESSYPPAPVAGRFLDTEIPERRILRVLQGQGFSEAINWAFTTPETERAFAAGPLHLIPISNPLTDEDTHLRSSLIPGLVRSVRRNLNYGTLDVRLFEIGKGYHGTIQAVQEESRLALAAIGSYYNPYWDSVADEFGFFHLKGVFEALAQDLRHRLEFRPLHDHPALHPGIAANVILDGVTVGWAGQLHPTVAAAFKISRPLLVAEISLGILLERPPFTPLYQTLNRFPAVERDLSFLVDRSVEYGQLTESIQGLELSELRTVELIDLYEGKGLPEGRISLTIRLTFSSPERTLTQEEVQSATDRVSETLQTKNGATPRA